MMRTVGFSVLAALTLPAVTHAQSLSGATVQKNSGNGADAFSSSAGASFQRTTSITVLSSTSSQFQTQYREVLGTDAFGLGSALTVSQSSDYSLSFAVTAPGAYVVTVSSSLRGAFTIVDDGATAPAHADLTNVTGTFTGGTLTAGTLSLDDPDRLDGTNGDLPFEKRAAAAIAGISNGVAQTHTLRFTWSGSCQSDAGTNGAECAVRLGHDIDYADESAGDYPGAGSRAIDADGHFVTVTVQQSGCGNGLVEPDEDCDRGSANGAFTSCCTGTCDFRGLGQVCRPIVGACDVQESCTGVSPTCPPDGFRTAGIECRASAGVCDVAEQCTGTSAACPADAKLTNTCRVAAGICDVAESCDGVNPACPTDVLRSTSFVCRPAVDACDVADTCNGVTNQCPSDSVQPVTTICRPAAGACDIAEHCNGTTTGCPSDAKSTALCRAAAGVCDVAESCNGVSNTCPPDVFRGSTGGAFVCRAQYGICDTPEICDGTGPNCPFDRFQPAGTLCRSANGVCDVADTCNGTDYFCPPDAVAPSGQVCRPAAGPCDRPEACTGGTSVCPVDTRYGPTVPCRAAANACDVVEYCSGASNSCPADQTSGDSDADTVCDQADNCPALANPSQTDADGDTFGDACDPCTAPGGNFTTRTKLSIKGLLQPAGNQKLGYQGEMVVPTTPALSLITTGARLVITDATHTILTDVTIPPGAYSTTTKSGWKLGGGGTTFTYKSAGNPTPRPNGIKKLSIKQLPAPPRRIKFTVKGVHGTYPVNLAHLPLQATLIIEGTMGAHGQCADSTFAGPPPAPLCTQAGGQTSVICR